jgi:hypothetical protein
MCDRSRICSHLYFDSLSFLVYTHVPLVALDTCMLMHDPAQRCTSVVHACLVTRGHVGERHASHSTSQTHAHTTQNWCQRKMKQLQMHVPPIRHASTASIEQKETAQTADNQGAGIFL